MRRQLRMSWFELRQFASVPYFAQLMTVATLTAVVTQALAWHAWGGDPAVLWVRGGVIGMWTVSTCAAGILGFERYKGTLVYLVSGRIDPRRPLAAVVGAVSTFGLAAMPLAWAVWWAFTGTTGVSPAQAPRLIGGTLLLWVACLSVAFVIATVFVLTPNAISYESLLLTPVLIASGMLFTRSDTPSWLRPIAMIMPIHWPIAILLGVPSADHGIAGGVDATAPWPLWADAGIGLMVSAIWMAVAWRLGRMVLDRACRDATLEVI